MIKKKTQLLQYLFLVVQDMELGKTVYGRVTLMLSEP